MASSLSKIFTSNVHSEQWPEMPTIKRKRVAVTKKRRHASPVTSSQNSCAGEANLQEVRGRHASPVTSSHNSRRANSEANLQKLAVWPVKMASSSHRRGNYHSSSISDDIALLAGMFLLLDTSSSEEEEGEILRRPQRMFPISGQEYMTLLLNGDPDTMRYTLRVDARTFRTLVNLLVKRGRLKWDCMRLSVEESLAIFLYICGHGKRHRCAANRFKRSMNTIARHFKYMMRALGNIAYLVIRPPDLNEIPFEILHDKIYYPWFENCVGAIGGTCIKGGSMYAQKVMAACSFDEKFTFVYAGWESWASDSQILEAAVNPRFKFPHPPANKYYLVDAGCTNMPGYLAPYHQKDDLNGVTMAYHSATDLFNHKHSSLRNVIERCVLKARFRVLKAMPKYKTARQPKIVVAYCVVHNWVLMQRGRDEFFKQIEEEVGYRKFLDMYIDMSCEAMAKRNCQCYVGSICELELRMKNSPNCSCGAGPMLIKTSWGSFFWIDEYPISQTVESTFWKIG